MRRKPKRSRNASRMLGTLSRSLAAILTSLLVSGGSAAAAETAMPNVLWLSSEDHGPHLGCYGDRYASTPNVDALAKQGKYSANGRRCSLS